MADQPAAWWQDPRRAGPACILGAVLTLALLYLLIVWGPDKLATHDLRSLTHAQRAADLPQAMASARSAVLTLAAGLAGAAAFIFTWQNLKLARRQLTSTENAQQKTLEITEQGQVTDRYTRAVEQIGSDKTDVRIGGIYALERVARDSSRDQPTIMEVLTAFVREHSRQHADTTNTSPTEPPGPPAPDIQAALTVIARRDPDHDQGTLNLADAVLAHADLTGAHLDGANLQGAQLQHATLTEAHLAGADLRQTQLDKAKLDGADLTNADIAESTLTFADLSGAILRHAKLREADLTSARLTSADLSHADLRRTKLISANLRHATMHAALLSQEINVAVLSKAQLQGAVITQTELYGVAFDGANLTDADLTGSKLGWFAGVSFERAKLISADLSRARLQNCNLKDAGFRGTKLAGCNLQGTDITSALLTGADITGADLSGAIVHSSENIPPGYHRASPAGVIAHNEPEPPPDAPEPGQRLAQLHSRKRDRRDSCRGADQSEPERA
jgi:uncharacterized protein YjbI with pentapeptide repeats